jgi:hypothetical protein
MPFSVPIGEGIGALCANSSFPKGTRNDWRSLLRQLVRQSGAVLAHIYKEKPEVEIPTIRVVSSEAVLPQFNH